MQHSVATNRNVEAASLIALADLAPDGNEPTWNVLLRAGQHHARSGGASVPVTESDLEAMVRNFADVVKAEGWFPHGAPIDANHATIKGDRSAEATKALGYIVDVKKGVDEDGTPALLGLTDWTDEGRARIKAREFQAFSAEFFPSGKAHSKQTGEPVKGAVLFGGTLTNHPFVSGLPAIAASEDDTPAPIKERNHMKHVATHLGLAEDAAEASILDEVRKRDTEIATLSEQVTGLTEKNAATAKALDDAIAQRDALQAEADKRAEADKAALLDEFVAQGRIANTDEAKADVWAVVKALGEDKARDLYKANGEFRTEPTGHDGGRDTEQGGKTAEELFAATLAEAKAAGKSDEEAYHFARDKHAAALAERYN